MEAVGGNMSSLHTPHPCTASVGRGYPLWSLRGRGDPLTATNITAPRVLDGKLEPQMTGTLALLASHRKPTPH